MKHLVFTIFSALSLVLSLAMVGIWVMSYFYRHVAFFNSTPNGFIGGSLPLPNAPGLGVELDEDLIDQTPFKPMNQAQTLLRNDGSVAFSV